jgi:hypothetical protein
MRSLLPVRRFRRLALLALALAAGACVNPFKPADPEPPDASGVIEDFSIPDEVLNTMATALQTRSTNGANAYIHAYAESTATGDLAFRAFYDGAVKTNWQAATQLNAPEPWDVTLERNVHSYLSGLRPTHHYTWRWDRDDDSPLDGDYTAADTVLYHRLYVLEARVNPEDVDFDTIAIGFADLSFEKKDGRWHLFRWVDRVHPAIGVIPANSDHRTMSWWRLESLTN